MTGEVPVCPRGHPDGRVVRDGIQRDGGRPRQRWRCILPDGSYHRFLGVVSRTRTSLETCVECESHLAPYEGPAAPARFEYLIREIAGALVDMGRGSTYTDAARRVRMQAFINTPGKLAREVKNGQTVAEWMADFVPVVSAPHAPGRWPEVLVLDSVPFWWRGVGDVQAKTPLYSVLAAYGYDENGRNGKLWRMEAHPTRTVAAWTDFLARLPGNPVSIIADEDTSIRGAITARWGAALWMERYHSCEYHLYASGSQVLSRTAAASELRGLFHNALTSREAWDAFEIAAKTIGPLAMQTWVMIHGEQVRRQTTRRSSIPPVYANGALENALTRVRTIIGEREFSYRNRARLNLLLELIRLAQLRADNAADYATAIRAYLIKHQGRPKRSYREIYDHQSTENGTRTNSLWSPAAQLRLHTGSDQKATEAISLKS
jgi:hypothetical protein